MLNKFDRVPLMELVRARQMQEVSRREFLQRAAAFVGSATLASTLLAACQSEGDTPPPPVVTQATSASTPMASSPAVAGFISGLVTYPDQEGNDLIGYLAYEDKQGAPRPIVIVLQEWWGLNEHIKEVTDRVAQAGYIALAPDLYHGQVTTEPDEARKLVMALSETEAVAEIQHAIAYLRGQAFTTPKAAVMGFCMGGGLVAATAAATPDLAAGVIFYGSPLAPGNARTVQAAIMTHLGSEDGISSTSVETMHAIFSDNGLANEFHLYEGAQHAFFNNTRPSYDAEAATLAWDRTLTWFSQHLS